MALQLGARLRKRYIPNPKKLGMHPVGDVYIYVNGNWQPHPWGSTMSAYNDTPWAKLESCMDEIHAGPPYASGGPFSKISITHPPFKVIGRGSYDSQGSLWPTGVGNYPVKYVGGFTSPQFVGDPIPNSIYANLDVLLDHTYLCPSLQPWAAQAWSSTAPSLEKAGLGVALGESRDLPRMMGSTAAAFGEIYEGLGGKVTKSWKMPPKIADDFLNVQFGWIPFVRDLQKLDKTFDEMHQHNSRITRENGKWIHRKRVLSAGEPIYTRIDGGIGQRCEPLGGFFSAGNLFSGQPTWECGMTTSFYVSTSGLFKYYRPEFDANRVDYTSLASTGLRHATILGARVNPSNIYKLIPWSWLVDWFTGFGNVVDRANDWGIDSIVAKYLYLMHFMTRKVTLTQVLPFKSGSVVLQWHRLVEVKRREEAGSNYGFGPPSGLTARQLAIIAALGLSDFKPGRRP